MLLPLRVCLLGQLYSLLSRFGKIKYDRFIDLFLIPPKCEILRCLEILVKSEVISRKACLFPYFANRCLEAFLFAFNFPLREVPIVVSVI